MKKHPTKKKPVLGGGKPSTSTPTSQEPPPSSKELTQAERVRAARKAIQDALDFFDCALTAHMTSEPFGARVLVSAQVTVIPTEFAPQAQP